MSTNPSPIESTQPLLLGASTDSHHFECSNTSWSVFGFTSRAPDSEGANEDALLVHHLSADHCILAVADGVGGMKQGHLASRLALDILSSHLQALESVSLDATRSAILSAMESAHQSIRSSFQGAASTMAIAELCAKVLRTFHVGDSSVLACGNKGRLVCKTIDHSPTGYGVEAGLLEGKESLHHQERHLLSNALGLDELRFEFALPCELAARDTIVVATDGLFDNLYTQEVIEIIRKGPLRDSLQKLIDLSSKRMDTHSANMPSKPDDRAILLARRIPGKS